MSCVVALVRADMCSSCSLDEKLLYRPSVCNTAATPKHEYAKHINQIFSCNMSSKYQQKAVYAVMLTFYMHMLRKTETDRVCGFPAVNRKEPRRRGTDKCKEKPTDACGARLCAQVA